MTMMVMTTTRCGFDDQMTAHTHNIKGGGRGEGECVLVVNIHKSNRPDNASNSYIVLNWNYIAIIRNSLTINTINVVIWVAAILALN